MVNTYQQQIDSIIQAGARLWQRGLIAAADGNLSLLLEDNSLLITASGISKGLLRPEHILRVNRRGELLQGQGRPSIELQLHLAVYAANPTARAIIHAHPPKAIALTMAGVDINSNAPEEARWQLGPVAQLAYAEAGSPQLAENVGSGMGSSTVGLMERHGAITVGDDIMACLTRMEALEQVASIMLYTRLLAMSAESEARR